MADPADVLHEMERATAQLQNAVGDELSTIAISSASSEEAVFLGQNISKLSPLIGNLIERRIPLLLQESGVGAGLEWRRQDPGFPDAALFSADSSVGSGFEVKAWYPMATEITGRFRESQNLLAGKDIRMVVVAWMMSHIVFGTPEIVGVLVVDALGVAQARDGHYHNPPDYLCDEPQDTTLRTSNLQQTNVLGFKLQEQDPTRLAAVERVYATPASKRAGPETVEGQELARQALAAATYRQDSNFAKIDRVQHGGVEEFKAAVLAKQFRGRSIAAWTKIVRALANDKSPGPQRHAAALIEELYAEGQI